MKRPETDKTLFICTWKFYEIRKKGIKEIFFLKKKKSDIASRSVSKI